MDQKAVDKLEGKIEVAIAEIIVQIGLKNLPLLPARTTMHMRAKAAVTVYETAVESRRREERTMAFCESLAERIRHALAASSRDAPDS
jgi:hypothetical protein